MTMSLRKLTYCVSILFVGLSVFLFYIYPSPSFQQTSQELPKSIYDFTVKVISHLNTQLFLLNSVQFLLIICIKSLSDSILFLVSEIFACFIQHLLSLTWFKFLHLKLFIRFNSTFHNGGCANKQISNDCLSIVVCNIEVEFFATSKFHVASCEMLNLTLYIDIDFWDDPSDMILV